MGRKKIKPDWVEEDSDDEEMEAPKSKKRSASRRQAEEDQTTAWRRILALSFGAALVTYLMKKQFPRDLPAKLLHKMANWFDGSGGADARSALKRGLLALGKEDAWNAVESAERLVLRGNQHQPNYSSHVQDAVLKIGKLMMPGPLGAFFAAADRQPDADSLIAVSNRSDPSFTGSPAESYASSLADLNTLLSPPEIQHTDPVLSQFDAAYGPTTPNVAPTVHVHNNYHTSTSNTHNQYLAAMFYGHPPTSTPTTASSSPWFSAPDLQLPYSNTTTNTLAIEHQQQDPQNMEMVPVYDFGSDDSMGGGSLNKKGKYGEASVPFLPQVPSERDANWQMYQAQKFANTIYTRN